MPPRIVPVSTLDPTQEELAHAWSDTFAAAGAAVLGDDHDVWSFASRQARESSDSYERHYLALLDSTGARVIAAADLALPAKDNLALGLLELCVHPDHQRQGHGSALLAHVTALARSAGRHTLVAESSHPTEADGPATAFARHHGFAAAQTNLRQDLLVADWSPEPTDIAGYVIETSTDDTLEAWLEDRAVLQTRMSTAVPLGDLAYEEEVWDAARIEEQRRSTRRSGRRALESVARDLATGRLVAFTQMQIPTADPGVAYQQDTLVLREHRGHGLGLAMKTASMAALRREFPDTQVVRTWNAVENAPMIGVNVALGYRPTAYLTEWQKDLG